MKHILWGLSLILLAGCGGGSDSDAPPLPIANTPLDTKYFGRWEWNGLVHILVHQEGVTTYVYDSEQGCYQSGFFNTVSSTTNSLTTEDIETGETATSRFQIIDQTLRVTEDGETLDFAATDNSFFHYPNPACQNIKGIEQVTIELTLAYLPPYITVNRDTQNSGYVEYQYSIDFDLNKNGMIGAGDISVSLNHYKSNTNNFSPNEQIPIERIGASIWAYIPAQQENKIYTISSTPYSSIPLEKEGNTLRFTVNTAQHAALMHISPDTPVKISTHINYPQPEPEILNGFEDGPWKWSSTIHIDELPETGFIIPGNEVGMILRDPANDLKQGESTWVDILSVQFIMN